MIQKIAIIGLGSPLRCDDGIGLILLEKLIAQKNKFDSEIEFIDGGIGGLNLLYIIEDFNCMILLDAVNFNGLPGEYKIFSIDDVECESTLSLSTHESNFANIINLGKTLGKVPEKIFIFGVQPKNTSSKIGISHEINEKIDTLLFNCVIEINKIIADNC